MQNNFQLHILSKRGPTIDTLLFFIILNMRSLQNNVVYYKGSSHNTDELL